MRDLRARGHGPPPPRRVAEDPVYALTVAVVLARAARYTVSAGRADVAWLHYVQRGRQLGSRARGTARLLPHQRRQPLDRRAGADPVGVQPAGRNLEHVGDRDGGDV